MVISSLCSAFHLQYSTLFLDTDVPACGNACHIIVDCAWFTFQYLFLCYVSMDDGVGVVVAILTTICI